MFCSLFLGGKKNKTFYHCRLSSFRDYFKLYEVFNTFNVWSCMCSLLKKAEFKKVSFNLRTLLLRKY